MTKEGFTKIVNFMTPGAGAGFPLLRFGHLSDIMKIHYFFKNLLLYSQTHIRQTEGLIMMSEEGSTKIVNFMIPRAGFLCWGVVI